MKQIFNKRRPLELIIQIISWLLIFIFPLFFIERTTNSINWIQYFNHCLVPFSSLFIFYVNYLWLVPKYLFNNDKKRYAIFNVLFIVILVILLHFGMESFKDFPPKVIPKNRPPVWIFYARDFLLLLIVVVLSTAIKMSLRWREAENRLIISERERVDAELKNLRNQLNPHFLLNTLNNIYALIVFNSDKAQEAVQELSKLLRHVLYDNQQEYISLDKEIEFIRNYISLMEIRLSKNVFINVNLDTSENKDIVIAPLIFISLIENAFKHGISPTQDSFINISIVSHEDYSVSCEILNSNFPKNDKDKSGSGVGLNQVRRRLNLLYKNKYEWKTFVNENENTYVSILTIYTK